MSAGFTGTVVSKPFLDKTNDVPHVSHRLQGPNMSLALNIHVWFNASFWTKIAICLRLLGIVSGKALSLDGAA